MRYKITFLDKEGETYITTLETKKSEIQDSLFDLLIYAEGIKWYQLFSVEIMKNK